MPWFRIDDRAADHPKFLALSDGAFRLWVEGGMYCNRHLTDGVIRREALRGFRYSTIKRVAELQKTGLWDACDDGYQMHDYLDWNDSKSEVSAKKQAAKARTARWRDASRDAPPDASQDALVRSGVGTLSSVVQKEDASFASFWAAYPKKVGKRDAAKAWKTVRPAVEAVLAALAWQTRSEAWRREGGTYIPHPATYLRQGRWMDEEPAQAAPVGPLGFVYIDPCPHDPPCEDGRARCRTRQEIAWARQQGGA